MSGYGGQIARGQHRCPARGCRVLVPDRLFACLPHWQALPDAVRKGISRTARLSLMAEPRRAAIMAARAAWDEQAEAEAERAARSQGS